MESLILSPSASSRHRAPIQGHCVPTQASTSVPSLDQILTVPKTTDITIVGGGASGLAVTVELVKRVKAGDKQISPIMLIEKREKNRFRPCILRYINRLNTQHAFRRHGAVPHKRNAVQPMGPSQCSTFAQAPIPEPILVRPIPHPARRGNNE